MYMQIKEKHVVVDNNVIKLRNFMYKNTKIMNKDKKTTKKLSSCLYDILNKLDTIMI